MRSRNLKVEIISACNELSEGNTMAEKEMRNFALRDKNGNEISVFTGKAPRQAALKAANWDIQMSEISNQSLSSLSGYI
jgi:hypothetical protein